LVLIGGIVVSEVGKGNQMKNLTPNQIHYICQNTGLNKKIIEEGVNIIQRIGVNSFARAYQSSNRCSYFEHFERNAGALVYNNGWFIKGPRGAWKIRVGG
jgi:hypothetical protein